MSGLRGLMGRAKRSSSSVVCCGAKFPFKAASSETGPVELAPPIGGLDMELKDEIATSPP